MPNKPKIIQGGIHCDQRGHVSFVNGFSFDDIKRFYLIQNKSTDIIRAWQGHKYEKKYFYVTSGSFVICCVQIDDWKNPSEQKPIEKFLLSSNKSKILKVPPGYATGIKAVEDRSKLMVFSSSSLDQSKKDDYRYDKNLWLDWSKI